MPKDKYKHMTDEEMIQCIRFEDTKAMDFILEKYKSLVRKKARTLFLIGADQDDLIQEGMIGLYKAIRDFDIEKQTLFYPFAELCITRQIYNAIKASNRKKNIPLNTYISLNTPILTENIEGDTYLSVGDILSETNSLNPEKLMIDKESADMIEYELGRRLSEFEQRVLVRYINGFSYTQIAEQLGRQAKSIDNALQRIKSKLTSLLEEMR